VPAARNASPPITATGANSAFAEFKLQGMGGRANQAKN
jgi:hypothetical protein